MEIIRESDYKKTLEEVIQPKLKSIRKDGWLDSFDGTKLFYHEYPNDDAVRTVVMLHGFTESSEKYEEMIWYFLNSGSRVYIYDQRGHGKSGRVVEDKTITHVEKFSDYVQDFECFMDKVVDKSLPLFLFAHSMGGAVAGFYLEKHPDVFKKAILNSPMIAPSTGGFPAWVGRFICRFMILFGGAKKRIFLSSEYPGIEKFEDSCDTSEVRFLHYAVFKHDNEDYRNYSPSYRWTLESLKVCSKLLKSGEPEKIKTEIRLMQAGKDTVVSLPAQDKIAERIPNCRVSKYPDAKHEIYYSTDDVMDKYIPEVIGFFS